MGLRREAKSVTDEFRCYSKVKKWAKRYVSKTRRRREKRDLRGER